MPASQINRDKLKSLEKIVQRYHCGQVRKYTNEPYLNHLKSVSEMVSSTGARIEVVSAAYCHDIFEDTHCDYHTLLNELIWIGFADGNAMEICNIVRELTDQYTPELYPNLNRFKRKNLECFRLAEISPGAQTIKYADIIDNTKSIVEHDVKFAKVYLNEKREMLDVMKNGNPELRIKALLL